MSEDQIEMLEPRRVPARRGWGWLKEGFSMVFANPLHWIGALAVWIILNGVLSAVPVVNVLSALVAPVFLGGLMLGAREQDTGKRFTTERLFAGFTQNLGPLMVIGLVYMLGFIAVMLIMLVSVGGVYSITGGDLGPDMNLEPGMAASPMVWLPVLVGLALTVPLFMAYWFAPALVMLDGVAPLKAMKLSLRACAKNVLPFLVYGLIALVLFVLGTAALLVGLLIVVPVTVASIYTAYRDIFHG